MFRVITRVFLRVCDSIGLGPAGTVASATISLNGTLNGPDNHQRVTVFPSLLDCAVKMLMHIDGLRQRNIAIALGIFAGLFGFGLKFAGTINAFYASLALTLLMGIFAVLDRRLHMFVHGWRQTRRQFIDCLAQAINDKSQAVSFARYRRDGERRAEWLSLQPVTYYLLVVGGVLSFFVFR